MTVDQEEGNILKTVITAYGPNNTIVAVCIEPIIAGNLNGRDSHLWLKIPSVHGDVKNDNGQRILLLCAKNGLIVANGTFPNKNMH